MNYGFEEPPSRPWLIVGVIMGTAVGLVAGIVAVFIAMALGGMLADALPGMPLVGFCVFLAVGIAWLGAFISVVRSREASLSAKMMGSVAIATFLFLTFGEATGLVQIYPKGMHFYIVPGVDKPRAH
jgi:uncharacterized protein with PQ loop repeat